MVLSFLAVVLVPLAATAWYMYAVATDQYVSRVGFAVRSEQLSSPSDLLGGLSSLSGSSSSDTDILYEFIQSQDLVQRVMERQDLAEIYSWPEGDPIFVYDRTGEIEDLVDYWRRMVQVDYDKGTGLIELDVHAFRPDDAKAVAEAIVTESTQLINRLSAVAREDTTRYAREDLELALERLKTAREALTQFRSETRLVDPSADIQGQMGLLNSLETQLAEAQIEADLLQQTARSGDPRIEQVERRIRVIENLIEQERSKFGIGGRPGQDGVDYSTLVGEFERLTVDREYAETAFVAAQAALDSAIADANRQSRYLATYNSPTLPQSSRAPQRLTITVVTGLFLFLAWCVGALVYYSLRDRR